MLVQPYLFFEGRCEEALKFYAEKLGAQSQMMMRYKEGPQEDNACSNRPEMAEKIMHASFRVGETELMASDGMCSGKPNFQGVSLSLTVDDVAQAEQFFNALAEGGQVQMALTPTFFAKRFGMVADKFGLSWMVLGGLEHGAPQ
jgi:PhnB protein